MDGPEASRTTGCRSGPRGMRDAGAKSPRRASRSSAFDDIELVQPSGILALEPHYAPGELAELWGMSGKLIRSIFLDEAGVLKIDRPEQRNKRGYCSLRIPQSTAIRVHRRLSRPRG